mgnify:CR=1 FL=1
MKKKTIWVIDDDPIYQIIINKTIQRFGLFSAISTFKNGKIALDALLQLLDNDTALPDIILLDINMPVMDGWEFMEEIRLIRPKFTKQIGVYIISSSIAVEDKNKSMSYENILGYLSKPVTVDDLISIASTV